MNPLFKVGIPICWKHENNDEKTIEHLAKTHGSGPFLILEIKPSIDSTTDDKYVKIETCIKEDHYPHRKKKVLISSKWFKPHKKQQQLQS